MKIYTRTGDDGTTGLLGPTRVAKSSARVEAFGSVDELNAAIGTARVLDREEWLAHDLAALQSQLFEVGAELATEARSAARAGVGDVEIAELERRIDALDAELPPLRNFVLPGGTALAAQLHLARAICRRAERRLVAFHEREPMDGRLVRYLNRLGDLLFVMARWSNHRGGVPEIEWRSRGGRSG